MKKAWLITWDWDGEHTKVDDPFIGIFSARRSAKQVAFFIENYYLVHTFSAEEMIYCANRKKPYSAEAHINDGITHNDRWIFGDNPFIYARRVTDLEITSLEEENMELLTWQEPALAAWKMEEGKKRMVKQEGPRSELRRKL